MPATPPRAFAVRYRVSHPRTHPSTPNTPAFTLSPFAELPDGVGPVSVLNTTTVIVGSWLDLERKVSPVGLVIGAGVRGVGVVVVEVVELVLLVLGVVVCVVTVVVTVLGVCEEEDVVRVVELELGALVGVLDVTTGHNSSNAPLVLL